MLEELALKSLEHDDCLTNKTSNQLNNAFADSIQDKLFRLEVSYAKRLKIQQICFETKLSGLRKNIKELTSEMEVSGI